MSATAVPSVRKLVECGAADIALYVRRLVQLTLHSPSPTVHTLLFTGGALRASQANNSRLPLRRRRCQYARWVDKFTPTKHLTSLRGQSRIRYSLPPPGFSESRIHLASATAKPLGCLWLHVQGFINWAKKNLDSGLYSSLRGLPT